MSLKMIIKNFGSVTMYNRLDEFYCTQPYLENAKDIYRVRCRYINPYFTNNVGGRFDRVKLCQNCRQFE